MRRLLLAGVTCAAALATLGLATAQAAAPTLRVGVGRADITPLTGGFKGGWASSSATATGQHTRLFARAIVLQRGGEKFALVSEDLAFVAGGMVKHATGMLADRGFSERNVIVTGSHTHSSQTGYMNFPAFNSVLPARGAPTENELADTAADPAMYAFMTRQLAAAIRRADDDLAPGALGWGETILLGVTRNRSVEAHLAEHGIIVARGQGSPEQDPEGPVDTIDPEVHVLRVDKLIRGRRVPVGTFSSFANHGTVVGPDSPYFSADHHGSAQRYLERALRRSGRVPAGQDVVAAYGNADEGDMTAGLDHFGSAGADEVGRLEGAAMLTAWRDAGRKMTRRPALASRWTRVCFCGQDTAEGPVDDAAVIGLAAAGGSEELRTIFQDLSPVTFEGQTLLPADVGPQGRKIPTLDETGSVPKAVPLLAMRVGDRAVVTVPGEMSAGMGRRLRNAITAATGGSGVRRTVIAGLANEYLSYFVSPKEYDRQHYEGGFTLYGRTSSLVVQEGLVDLARRLADGRPAPDPYDFDPTNGVAVTDAEFPAGATTATVIRQPGDVQRLEQARFSWRGAPRGADRPVEAPFVRMQRRVRGRWRPLTDDLGTQIGWTVTDDGTHEALWEIPHTTAAGVHRFVITARGYEIASDPFRVSPTGALIVERVLLPGGRTAVRLAYPKASPGTSLTYRPPHAAGGRVTFVTGGRRTVVRHARATTFVTPRDGDANIPAGGARDRYGNHNAGDVSL